MISKFSLRSLLREDLAADIMSKFRVTAVQGAKTFGPVKGLTVKEVKVFFRGEVPQDQKKFIEFMTKLGFDVDWSKEENAWVVHK